MFHELEQHLQTRFPLLKGDWLHRHSDYEDAICEILTMKSSKCRYWDAEWNNYYIEFKKGRSIWLDLVRYSEILQGLEENARKETICLFFIPNKERSCIEEIICVKTSDLITEVKLDSPRAESLMQLKKALPRSLNAQASLTVNDVRKIKTFTIR
jgi:hypothetical protein